MADEVKGLLCGCRNQGLLNAAYTAFYSRIFKLESGYHIIMVYCFFRAKVPSSALSLFFRDNKCLLVTLSKPACMPVFIRKLYGNCL